MNKLCKSVRKSRENIYYEIDKATDYATSDNVNEAMGITEWNDTFLSGEIYEGIKFALNKELDSHI